MYYVCIMYYLYKKRTMIYFSLGLYCTKNVRVRSGTEPEPPFGFMFGGFAEPNPEHSEHCSEPDRGQSTAGIGCLPYEL